MSISDCRAQKPPEMPLQRPLRDSDTQRHRGAAPRLELPHAPQLPQHHPSLPHKNTHNHAPRGTRTSAGSDTPPPPSLANAHTHRSIAGWSAQHVKWAWRTGVGLRQAHSRCSGANAVPTRRARLPLRHVHRMPCTHWRDGKKARRLLSKHLPQQTCSNSPSLAFSVGSVLIWTPWLLQYLCFISF